MPEVGDVVAGKYEIVEMVGEGGMGAVFAANHKLTGKRVALKWLLPELASKEGATQRFMREAQAAGRIDHPNVVDVYDVGEHEGAMFLVMEFLRGESLTDALERGGLSPSEVIGLLIPAMRGVASAHRRGVVHRDLKPDNIFLCHDDHGHVRAPKVLDFGISKVSSGDGDVNPRLTKTGAVMGTPYYMSPEQIRGSHEVDQRADVYAFGVILYEALTGHVPFNAETYSALILEIATGTPRKPRELNPDLPEGLQDVVIRAMAREVADRYESIESLAEDLLPYTDLDFAINRRDATERTRVPLTGAGVTATPFAAEMDPLESSLPVPIRRGRGAMVGGLGALAAALVGGWFFLAKGPPPEIEPAEAAAPAPAAPAPPPVVEPPSVPAEAPKEAAAQDLPSGKAPPVPHVAPEPPKTAPKVSAAAKRAAEKRAVDKRAAEKRAAERRAAARRARRERQPSLAAPPKPPRPSPPARKPPVRRGRTGGLSVDDF